MTKVRNERERKEHVEIKAGGIKHKQVAAMKKRNPNKKGHKG